ncbi:MAG: radical SAM protein [Desulfobacteraceae bacterium]|nr:radical SAM protein [Desulfobacteraceae bacterium]
MLTGIHFLLTYACNFECDHCFLYCSPGTRGTFTLDQIKITLNEAEKIGTIDWIFFEGGEPFLYYPLLKKSIALANKAGFKTGVVTNAYPANTVEDARLWLEPLQKAGLDLLSISNDEFHHGDDPDNPAATALETAKKLKINTSPIRIEPPHLIDEPRGKDKGSPVVGGGPRFRGRAVEKLAKNLPLRPWKHLSQCPDEDLTNPSRVHVDSFGHVHLCQGISMGNMWKTPLSELVDQYRPDSHPIVAPIIQGGPAALAKILGVTPDQGYEKGYVDECHLCYTARRAALDRFPQILAPRQVYGIG